MVSVRRNLSAWAIPAAVAMAVVTVAGCTPRTPFDPALKGREFFLCCNLRFNEDRDATDANYEYPQGRTLVVGTPVRVVEVRGTSVTIATAGDHKPYYLELRYGGKRISPRDYFANILLENDPTPRLAQFPSEVAVAIREGTLLEAMTKEQAIMARGYPPFHRTVGIEADEWIYFRSRGLLDRVRFFDGKIAAIDAVSEEEAFAAGELSAPVDAAESIRELEERRERADRVIVLAGGLQPNRPYRVLGPVAAQEVGGERQKAVEQPRGSSFKRVMLTPLYDPLRYAEKPETEVVTYDDLHMDVLLKNEAIAQFGDEVDAIINATYSRLPNGTVAAKGLAVHFTGPEAESSSHAADDSAARLRQLKQLLDEGLISDEEYEKKRLEVLDDL